MSVIWLVPVVALALGAVVAAIGSRWLRQETSTAADEAATLATLRTDAAAVGVDADSLRRRLADVRAAARSRQGDG